MSDIDQTPDNQDEELTPDAGGSGSNRGGDPGFGEGAPPGDRDVTVVTIEEEMQRSYLDYAMSVIVSRALPDVCDGLKPVHRRILYTMKSFGYDWNQAYSKSARIVGDVMGNFHPHGDSAIYDAMVRMAQEFSMRLPFVNGQGNFGSMDGDPPAAMRYTEARLTRAASESLLEDIEKDTVDFVPNYDEKSKEPTLLPARIPNLLANGAGGIAVGMATNIPPHNLGELIDLCCAYLDNPGLTVDEMMEILPAPDFPTGGIILGRAGVRSAYHTGRGSIIMRGRTTIEGDGKDRESIVITEVPFQVNKARMLERIAEVVREKIVDGIAEIRDESDRHGLRVVVDLKRDAMADVVLNQLYRYSPLQTSFGVNMLAINAGRPELLSLRDVIVAFIKFREDVVTRRTVHDLGKARERAHVLVGLLIAVASIDEIIATIRRSPDPQVAREELMSRAWPAGDVAPLIALLDEPGQGVAEDGTYSLSETQARAILDLRLQRLTGLERDKIGEELKGWAEKITDFLEILGSRERLTEVMRAEFLDAKERFATPRRTSIEDAEFEHDIEDLIPREGMVVTVTHGGYIKRVPLSTYRAQKRGGKGRAGLSLREDDFVNRIFVGDTHTPVLFFSSRGMVYKMKVYRLPLGAPQARGKALVNILPLSEGETITAFMALPEDESAWEEMYVMFATTAGTVRRNKLSDFTNVMANGKIAMKLEESDGQLVDVLTCGPDDDVLLATAAGKAIRFQVEDVRVFAGRNSVGVRGIRLAEDDSVISMSILRHSQASSEERDAYLRHASALRRAESANGGEEDSPEPLAEDDATLLPPDRVEELAAKEDFILSVAEDGFGKRTSAYEYRVTGRGGQGIGNMDLTRGEGSTRVIAAFPVVPGDEIMLMTDAGKLIRTSVDDIRIAGRTTRGVTLFKVDESERVVSVAHLADLDQADEEEEGELDGAEPENEGSEADAPEHEGSGTDEPDGA